MDGAKLEISMRTAICAARHFVAAHESACRQRPVDWTAACAGCSESEGCRSEFGWFGWLDVMGPIFIKTGIHPKVHDDGPTDG